MDEFSKEIERLAAEQLSYAGQTNQLYFDKDNFSSEAYVALADWSDRYEYAIIMEDASTILYVYLENMTRDDLHMDETYLPAYFQDNNQSESTEESMTAEHRSFYAFKIGSQYVDCMDLVNTEEEEENTENQDSIEEKVQDAPTKDEVFAMR